MRPHLSRPIQAHALAALALIALAAACHKVPLEADAGTIDFGTAHWFENEKTAYVFFSLAEKEARLIHPEWRLGYEEASAAGGVIAHPTTPIDFEQGVHLHRLVACGPDRICGSYSFHSDGALTRVDLGFRYDADSPMERALGLTVQNHAAVGPAGAATADAYSALVYGVFDEGNEHLAAVVHNNFGSPAHEDVAAFGMTRRFLAQGAALRDATVAEIATAAAKTSTPLLFPAEFCADVPAAGAGGSRAMTDAGAWLPGDLPAATGARGACFRVDFLDKDGSGLGVTAAPAYGRRNPDLSAQGSLTLLTPLAEVVHLPVVIRICDDDPAAGAMVDADYFDYQRFIVGVGGRPADLCFKIGEEKDFAKRLDDLLARQLAAAKVAAAGPSGGGRDFMFVVVLHERFAPEFREVQATVAASLYALAAQELDAVTPRLAGALVYGSSTDFAPTATQRRLVLWCPQELIPQVLSPSAPLADQNCTTTKAVELDLQVINFVTPLGPMPSLKQYRKYVDDFGDKGLAHGPELRLASVPKGINTVTEGDAQVTYFDAARYAIAAGEAARLCGERTDDALTSFRVKPVGADPALPGVDINDINNIWLGDNAAGEYRLGIAWEYPFVGGIKYTGALTGKALSIVPFQKSFPSYQALGDPKWTTESWDFGRYVQHCRRYCDNPYFDAAGTYQASQTWRGLRAEACPAPVYPIWPGAS